MSQDSSIEPKDNLPRSNNTKAENGKPYRAFLSYCTEPDYKLAQEIENYLESFHQRAGIKQLKLDKIEVCRDGSDFRLPTNIQKNVEPTDLISMILDSYLGQSEFLVVLCSCSTPNSQYVIHEITTFIKIGNKDKILLVVTEGEDPSRKPVEVFPNVILDAKLEQNPWYDFRSKRAKSNRSWKRVRDYDDEIARLAAHLNNDAVGRIYPSWQRQKEREKRRRKVILVALIFTAIAVFGFWGWSRTNYYQILRVKDAFPELVRLSYSEAKNSSSAIDHIITELVSEDYIDLAFATATNIGHDYRKIHALRLLAKNIAKRGDVNGALKAADKINNPKEQAEAYAEIAVILLLIGRTEDGIRTAERAYDTLDKIDKMDYKISCILDVTRIMSQNQQSELARIVAQKLMTIENQTPAELKAKLWVEIAVALKVSNQNEQASALAQKSLGFTEGIIDPAKRNRALNDIAFITAEAGFKDIPIKAFNKIEGYIHTAYKFVLQGAVNSNTLDLALAAIEAMENRAALSDRNWYVPLSEEIVTKLATTNRGDFAYSLAEKISDPAYKIQAIMSVALSLSKNGNNNDAIRGAEQAAQIVHTNQDSDIQSIVLTDAATVMETGGRYPEASRLALEALMASRKTKDPVNINFNLIELANVLAKVGLVDEAVSIREIFKMRPDYQTTSLPTFADSATGNIVKELAVAGNYDRAFEIAKTIETERKKNEAIDNIIELMSNNGQDDLAMAAISRIGSRSSYADTTPGLALKLAKSARSKLAIAVAARVTDEETLGRLLPKIAVSLARSGDKENATKVAEKGLPFAKKISFTPLNIFAMIDVANSFAIAGQKKRSIELLNEIETQIKSLTDEKEQSLAWIMLAKTYIDSDEYLQAKRIADEVPFASDKLMIFNIMLRNYAIASNPELAKVLSKIKEKEDPKKSWNESDFLIPWPID